MQKERDSKYRVDNKPDIGKQPGVGPTHKNLRLTPNRRFLLGLYCMSPDEMLDLTAQVLVFLFFLGLFHHIDHEIQVFDLHAPQKTNFGKISNSRIMYVQYT